MFKKALIYSLVLILVGNFFVFSKSYAAADIVNTHQTYTYDQMTKDIKALKARYPGLVQVQSIGKTYFGRDLWAVKIGTGDTNILINASHHAREWIGTVLTMEMMEQYLKAYVSNSTMNGYNVRDVLTGTSIWFVPMVNPDGVTLEQKGVNAFPAKYRAGLIKMNGGSTNFSSWKANARGIDLNRQYPPNWNTPVSQTKPGPNGYKGTKPFQAEEVIALRNFTEKVKPKVAVAYHSSGQILYWNYHVKKESLARDTRIAKQVGTYTGYQLMPVNSGGGRGYTDWFIQQFNLPGLTPELSSYAGLTSVPLSNFPKIWSQNKPLGLYLASEAYLIAHPNAKATSFKEHLKLPSGTSIYKTASFESRDGQISGTVSAYQQEGNWYKIHTSKNGDQWVYIPQNLKYFPDRTYLDVPEAFWAKSSVDYVSQKGWMKGTSTGVFSPNAAVTKAQLAYSLVHMLNLPLANPDTPAFTDVPKTYWDYQEIETAVQKGLISGNPSTGSFNPSGTVTLDQMAVVLAQLFKDTPLNENQLVTFKDVTSTNPAYQQVELVNQLGIMGGNSDGTFGVGKVTTRAGFSVVLERIATKYPNSLTGFNN